MRSQNLNGDHLGNATLLLICGLGELTMSQRFIGEMSQLLLLRADKRSKMHVSQIVPVLLHDMHIPHCICEGKEREAVGGFLSSKQEPPMK